MFKKKIIQLGAFFFTSCMCIMLFYFLTTLVVEKNQEAISQTYPASIASEVLPVNMLERYSYSDSQYEFEIKNLEGQIQIQDDEITLFFETRIIEIPHFQFYRIKDENDNIRFFQADTYVEDNLQNPFVLIAVYLPSNDTGFETYTMCIQYGDESLRLLYNIKVNLANEEVEYFERISIDWVLGNDELSSRLKASVRVQSKGKDFESESPSLIQSQANRSAQSINYDSYTNEDGLIHAYATSYFGNYHKDDLITDDPIVQIIPKDLFFISGVHIYVGKAYGFFVNTIRTIGGDKYADVMVFDIFNRLPNFPSNTTGFSRITPLFQYRYRTVDDFPSNSGYDPNLTKVVYPHTHYDAAEYFINKIGFKHTVANPSLLNPGDNGYDAKEDDGAFIIQTRYNARGVGLKKKEGSFTKDTLQFGFGFVPYVGDILNVGAYVEALHNGFGNRGYFYSRDTWVEDNEANIETYETNNTDQIQVHGNLIKSVSSQLIPDENNPRLIHVGGGYAESKYVVARRSNSNYNKMNVVTSVSVNILEDNTYRTWVFGWKESGDIYEYGSAIGTYETSSYEHVCDITQDIVEQGYTSKSVKADSSHQVFRFVPTMSGTYLIQGHGVQSPNIIIHDATQNQSTDISYRHVVNAVSGHVYYIETFEKDYFYNYDYTVQIGYNPDTSNEIKFNEKQTVSLNQGDYMTYRFTPTSSGEYEIYTSKISGDPYLILINSSGQLLAYDDDGNGSLDSLICYNLQAGHNYYIIALGRRGTPATFDLKIKQGYPKLVVGQSIEVSIDHTPVIYAFTPTVTGTYHIYTDFSANIDVGNGAYPCLYLYDSNFNLLEYNEYGRGVAYHAGIAYTLNAHQKYYIGAGSINYNHAVYGLVIKQAK